MKVYRERVVSEISEWKETIIAPKSAKFKSIKRVHRRLNAALPSVVHRFITQVLKQTFRILLHGAEFTTPRREVNLSLHSAEGIINETIWFYASAATAQGTLVGLGGAITSILDFPLWISIKIKMLFEIAGHYGYDTREWKERLFILHILQLTFSTPRRRNRTLKIIEFWEQNEDDLPESIHDFNWRKFQSQYRDRLILTKILQLIPIVGAAIGGYTNSKHTYKLGKMAMNAYRLRLLQDQSRKLKA